MGLFDPRKTALRIRDRHICDRFRTALVVTAPASVPSLVPRGTSSVRISSIKALNGAFGTGRRGCHLTGPHRVDIKRRSTRDPARPPLRGMHVICSHLGQQEEERGWARCKGGWAQQARQLRISSLIAFPMPLRGRSRGRQKAVVPSPARLPGRRGLSTRSRRPPSFQITAQLYLVMSFSRSSVTETMSSVAP
jgi:hypothetical protein